MVESSTTEESSVVQSEGNRRVRRKIRLYNLDAIISVGYRVNSRRGTQFRMWATSVLRDHLIKGFSLNRNRLQELSQTVKIIADTIHPRSKQRTANAKGRTVDFGCGTRCDDADDRRKPPGREGCACEHRDASALRARAMNRTCSRGAALHPTRSSLPRTQRHLKLEQEVPHGQTGSPGRERSRKRIRARAVHASESRSWWAITRSNPRGVAGLPRRDHDERADRARGAQRVPGSRPWRCVMIV